MAARPPVCDFGLPAPDFDLPGTDGRRYRLRDIAGPTGVLVMFIFNHCPYVLAVIDRICRDATDLKALGIGVATICSNDAKAYPDDSFDNMRRMAERQGFPFPYLHDHSQDTARAYGAVCTPDFFGYNGDLELQYRGRLDGSGLRPAPHDQRRDLYDAMCLIAETGHGPRDQVPSMGCSIKWKAPQ